MFLRQSASGLGRTPAAFQNLLIKAGHHIAEGPAASLETSLLTSGAEVRSVLSRDIGL